MLKKKFSTVLGALVLAAACASVELACVVDDGGGSEGGTDGPTCNACPAGKEWGNCICQNGVNQTGCLDDAACGALCTGQPGTFTPMVCATAPDSGGCGGWNPTSAVRLVSGVRKVDDVWLANLVGNPAPLWTCDNAILDDISTGKFKVLQANAGEFLYQLGLRNNDIPQTLNNMPLISAQDGFDAFNSLYLQGVTNYTLKVKRGTSTITLLYLID